MRIADHADVPGLCRHPTRSADVSWSALGGGVPPREARTRRRAFTLLEISIGLVLMGLLIAVAVPSLNAVSGTRLREQSNVLAGAIRDTYARTAMLGRSTRLVLDLEAEAWWVEETEGVARVTGIKQRKDRDGKVELEVKDERLDGVEADTTDAKDQAKLSLLSGPTFRPVDGEWGQKQKLPADITFRAVWIEHLDDKVSGGQTALYFYPGGYTEEAIITLTDDEDGSRTLSLVVQPLTGEVYVEDEEPRVPTLEDDA